MTLSDPSSGTGIPAADAEGLEFTCPRCDQQVTERFYGPCDSCRADLRATQKNEQSDLESSEFEPKMNVTPNAVASKE